MEAEPRTKVMLDAYRDGVNAYIHTLNYRSLPIEYKLMSFEPEDWTNLRTALLMKYMARDLTGKTDDIAYTMLRDKLGQEEFDLLFPERIRGSKPVIPEGTKWDAPSQSQPKAPEGDVWAHFKDTATAFSGGDKDAPKFWHSTSSEKVGRAAQSLRENRFFQNDKVAENYVGQADEGSPNLCHSRRESHRCNKVPGPNENPEGSQRLCHSERIHAQHERGSLQDNYDWPGSLQPQSEEPGSESGIGSNNWAISGAHTASGKPILCNDPHLALNLPSLWYEMQLTAPGINAYGASLPGAPGIVIGFNEKISWGFTNNYRDVKDFYEISTTNHYSPRKEGASKQLMTIYLFEDTVLPFQHKEEVIKVKGGNDVIDTVYYTIHGPVTYDPSFPDPAKSGKLLACTWMAHRGSNEVLATYLLNRAGDYTAFTDAISHFECPAQNIAYADGAGNIAIWGQGRFINKWKDQGKYVMRGDDSTTLWGQSIPTSENPHVLNPPQGYIASANQQVTDSTYPYWYNGSFVEWRSWEISNMLAALQNRPCPSIVFPTSPSALSPVGTEVAAIPPFDPRYYCAEHNNEAVYIVASEMQNDVYSLLNHKLTPLLSSRKLRPQNLNNISPRNDQMIWDGWALFGDDSSATKIQIWWSQLYKDIWQDDFPEGTKSPSSEVTVQLLLSDSTSKYYDDRRTQQVETLRDIVQRAFKETTDSIERIVHNASTTQRFNDSTEALQWYNVKNTSLTHLAKLPAFSYDHLKIGGWSNTINAVTGNHGPSWRMIVEMDSIPKAYAIYPGGQSGNPGSKHYGDFIQQWTEGKYHAIQFLTAATTKNPLKYTWTLKP
jgi:acyl-homoserine lactone acylase PvdQ